MFEETLIVMGITALQGAIKDPALAAKFKTQLLEIAAAIQTGYGLTPPATS